MIHLGARQGLASLRSGAFRVSDLTLNQNP